MILHQGTRADGSPVTLDHYVYVTCVDCTHYFNEAPATEPSHVCERDAENAPMYEDSEHWVVATERNGKPISARFDSKAEAVTMYHALLGPVAQLTLL